MRGLTQQAGLHFLWAHTRPRRVEVRRVLFQPFSRQPSQSVWRDGVCSSVGSRRHCNTWRRQTQKRPLKEQWRISFRPCSKYQGFFFKWLPAMESISNLGENYSSQLWGCNKKEPHLHPGSDLHIRWSLFLRVGCAQAIFSSIVCCFNQGWTEVSIV